MKLLKLQYKTEIIIKHYILYKELNF